MSDERSNAGSNGRAPGGKFAPGNSFGRGNPNLVKMHALRRRLLDTVDEDAMGRVAAKLVQTAESGDLDAIKILLSYTIGRPPQAIELTGADGTPLGLDFSTIQAAILRALAGHPDARVKVAAELRTLIDVGGDGTGTPELGD
jgi:hypothetical protein